MNTEDSRLAYCNIYVHPGIFDPEIKESAVRKIINSEGNVTNVSKELRVSRKTIYRWLKEYKENGSLRNNYVKGFDHPRSLGKGAEAIVLSRVVKAPELSIHALARELNYSNHAVFNILQRNLLTHKGARITYSQAHISQISEQPQVAGIIDRIKSVFETFTPNLAPAPPPKFVSILKTFLISSGFSFIIVFGTLLWINVISGGGSFGAGIGLTFAMIALAAGSFFFIYSLKYYLTTAITLSFSNREKKENVDLKNPGMNADLGGIHIKKYPYISVQIPFYNEKNVVERSIKAATNFDYPAYEVILCDDSTDETTDKIRAYQQSCLFKGESLKVTKGDGWTLTTVEVRPGVTLKHLKRTTRFGYKGGALALALKLTDPRTEFVSIFDADFVPYPDSLNFFVKYFKISNSMSEDYEGSNIAAVQGYQWHVLNKSENWITRGVRSEYAGSYVVERSGAEIYKGLKQISGSVYMIRKDVLSQIGWGTSITEDFELTLKLYNAGFKVIYTPYIQAPAECVSTLRRLVRQRMRWAEGHSFNIKLMAWKLLTNPKLSLTEKLEFTYLMPYYLQAFFFLVGTFSWLLSESVFRVHLPFWTELWGWSLVLTNMISLPLLNAVGMFLEESPTKDYSGLASFVALSYIVVPFQAYAAVKGFLEKKEGPWFRTPKTGRVTDTLRRSEFYRFISGILPGRNTETANEVTHDFGAGQYLNLATANNKFDNFDIRNSRGRRWVGKLMLVTLLLISNTLLYFSGYIQTFAPQPVQAQQNFGTLVSPSQNLDNATQSSSLTSGSESPSPMESPSPSITPASTPTMTPATTPTMTPTATPTSSATTTPAITIPAATPTFTPTPTASSVKVSTLDKIHGLFNLEPTQKFDATINLDQKTPKDIKDVRINEKNNQMLSFKASETPEFSLDLSASKYKNIWNKGQTKRPELLSAEVTHTAKSGSGFEPQINFDESKKEVSFVSQMPDSFRPGLYKFTTAVKTSSGVVNIEQDFTWGVLAINTDKSLYTTGDTVNLGMAVLDDNGVTKCLTPDNPYSNAKLWLTITSPSGKETDFSTDAGSITGSNGCSAHSVTNTADFLASYQTVEAGTYQMHLEAENFNGRRTLDDIFMVSDAPAFEVTRNAPTRIYPIADYTNTITIKARQNFSGTIEEYLPASFEVKDENPAYKVIKGANKLIIQWTAEMAIGDTQTFSYKFKAPDYSPEFYLLGPLQIGNVFTETRSWQIASDATASFTSGSSTWTSPITGNISIELHGGGGGGGYGGTSNKYGGGGGAGGQAVVNPSVAVTKNTAYTYSVGGAGNGGTSTTKNGSVGGDTTLVIGSTTYTAKGGAYGLSYTNGRTGGTGSTTGGVAGTGGTVYAGGSGITGATTYSGGGGGGAGSTGTGKTGTTYTAGGSTANNGGAGGNGSASSAVAGLSGNNYGGGGGGGTKNSNGGAGAGGYILITYPDNTSPTVALNTPTNAATVTTGTPTLNFTGTDANYLDNIEYNVQIDTVNTFNSHATYNTLLTGNTNGGTYYYTFGSAYTGFGEQFTTGSTSTTLRGSQFYINKAGSPAGTAYAEVFSFNGSTVGSLLATSDGITATNLGNGWNSFTFSGAQQITLSANTSYVTAVIYSSGVTGNTLYIYGDSGDTYTTGNPYEYYSGAWDGYPLHDVMFQVYVDIVGPLINATSSSGAAGFTSGHPFTSGTAINYTVQSGNTLSSGTYYWRVAGIDPSGTNTYGAWSPGSGSLGYQTFTVSLNSPPTVSLNTPANAATGQSLTPTLNFTGTDVDGNTIEYNVQVDTVNTFNSQSGSPLISKVSTTDTGFTSGHPFASGTAINYTVQSALTPGTYYWRVAGIDPTGSNTYGAWSSVYSFITNVPPIITLNTPTDAGSILTSTPTLNFTGTDTNDDTIEYDVNIGKVSVITLDSQSSAATNPDSATLAWSHTIVANNNTYLVVGVGLRNGRAVSGITYGSQSLVYRNSYQAGSDARSEIWTLANPAVGAHTITVTASTSTTISAGAVAYTGVSGIGNIGGGGNTSLSTSSSLNITSSANNLVVDTINLQAVNSSLAANTGQTQRIKQFGTANTTGMSEKVGSATTTMGWTFTSDYWDGTAVELVAATSTPIDRYSVSDAGFTSGHPFASGTAINFTVQAGDALTVGTYLWKVRGTDPSGSNTYGAWSSTWSFSLANQPPTVSLNTPTDTGIVSSTTPTLNFTGTDPESNAIEYEVQIMNGWSLTGTTYDSKYISVSGQNTIPICTYITSDGMKMYLVGGLNQYIYEYSFGTAWDISTITYDGKSYHPTSGFSPNGLFFNPTGTKMYIRIATGVYQFSLSTPWDLSTTTDDGVNISTNAQDTTTNGLFFSSDGSQMYLTGWQYDDIYQYSLSTPWDLSTASYANKSLSVSQDSQPGTLFIDPMGKKMFMMGAATTKVYQYTLATPWDISSGSYDSVYFSTANESGGDYGVFFKTDGTKMYVTSDGNDSVYQYSVGQSALLDKFSANPDPGFTSGHPFASGNAVDYTVQSGDALSPGTYYWRVRATDPTGSNTYGSWSSTYSFTVSVAWSSANATAYSFQRKTFYDATRSVYWQFAYDATQIVVEYNTTPWTTGWTTSTAVAVNTNDFSLWNDNTYVYMAYYANNDIMVMKGTLSSTSISWGTAYAALNGTGSSDTYNYAYVTKDSANKLWVTGRYYNGTNYYIKAVQSTNADDPSAWGTASSISSTSSTDANNYASIHSLGSASMYAVWIRGTAIEGQKYTSGAWTGSTDSIATGKSGLSSNFSVSSDTNNYLHLSYIDASSYVQYRKYTTSWSGATQISSGTNTNAYTSVSVDTNNNNVYVLYIRSSSTAGTIYYNKYTTSWGGETATGWSVNSTNTNLSSNYADPGSVFAEWTSGSGTPYTVNWNYIIVPENMYLMIAFVPLVSRLIRRKKKALAAEERKC